MIETLRTKQPQISPSLTSTINHITLDIMSEPSGAPASASEHSPAPPASPAIPAPVQNTETQSFQQFYQDLRSNMSQWSKWSCEQYKAFEGWDDRVARSLTDLKRDYILGIGGLMNRSICMAVSSGLTYKLISSSSSASLLARTRNLGASFLINGWLFVPELFNPFLKKRD